LFIIIIIYLIIISLFFIIKPFTQRCFPVQFNGS